jgi:hypothetical protein
MNSPENQLADLLHSHTPQPPASIQPADLADRAMTGSTGPEAAFPTGSPLIRPALLVLAAACVIAIPVTTIVLSRHQQNPTGAAVSRATSSTSPPTSGASGSSAGTSSAPVIPPTTSATASPPAVRAPACAPAGLTVRVVRQAEAMEQMFVQIRLTNITGTACTLAGYPAITAWPDHTPHSLNPFAIHPAPGGTYLQADPGARQVLVNPHQTSSFTVQTSLGNNGGLPRLNIHELDIRLATNQPAIPVAMPEPNGLIATTPTGQPIPLMVSALTTP